MLKNFFSSVFQKNSPDGVYGGSGYSFMLHMQNLERDMPFPLLKLTEDKAFFEPKARNGRGFITVLKQLGALIGIGMFSNIKYESGCVPSLTRGLIEDRNVNNSRCEFHIDESDQGALIVAMKVESITSLNSIRFAEIVAELMVQVDLLDACILATGSGQRYR